MWLGVLVKKKNKIKKVYLGLEFKLFIVEILGKKYLYKDNIILVLFMIIRLFFLVKLIS